MLTTSLQELKSLNTCLRDEHAALQLLFASLEDKLRKVQVIYFILIEVSVPFFIYHNCYVVLGREQAISGTINQVQSERCRKIE